MLPEDFRQLPMVITPQGAYCRPDNEQLMIGWLHFTRPIEPDFDNQDVIEPGFAAGDMSGYGVAVRKAITAFLPDCENMGRLMATTCGFYADTEDHNPLIDFSMVKITENPVTFFLINGKSKKKELKSFS